MQCVCDVCNVIWTKGSGSGSLTCASNPADRFATAPFCCQKASLFIAGHSQVYSDETAFFPSNISIIKMFDLISFSRALCESRVWDRVFFSQSGCHCCHGSGDWLKHIHVQNWGPANNGDSKTASRLHDTRGCWASWAAVGGIDVKSLSTGILNLCDEA